MAIQLSVNRTAICEFVKFFDTPEPNSDRNVEVIVYDPYRLEMQTNLSLWQYTEKEHYVISKEDVLPMRPKLELVPSLSQLTRAGRKMVFQVENMDVIESLTKYNPNRGLPSQVQT